MPSSACLPPPWPVLPCGAAIPYHIKLNATEMCIRDSIKHLTKDIELKNPETQYGVGDDAAVLEDVYKRQLHNCSLSIFPNFVR